MAAAASPIVRGAVAALLLLLAVVATVASSAAAATPMATATTATTMKTAAPAQKTLPAPAAASSPPDRVARKHAAAKRRSLSLLLDSNNAPGGQQNNKRRGRRGGGGGSGGRADCDVPRYRSRVLGVLKEQNFLGLFKNLRGQTKLEASGMTVVGDDLWIIFDNTPLVGLVDLDFAYVDPHNALIPPVVGGGGGSSEAQPGAAAPPALLGQPSDSQFEGISAIPSRPGEFMIIEEMREVAPDDEDDDDLGGGGGGGNKPKNGTSNNNNKGNGDVGGGGGGRRRRPPLLFHPFAQRVSLSSAHPQGYLVLERCAVHLALTHENKGVEGIEYVEDTRGKGWLLAACEGNWCQGGRKGRDRGNGKIAVLEFVPASPRGDPCSWRVAKTLNIPPAAAFVDYSDVAFADPGFRGEAVDGGKGAVAVLSQEDAALWVGEFDYDKMEFVEEVPGAVFLLPKDGSCRTIWCNAEGVAWLDATRLAVATDRAKASQPHECTSKDEALATFALPDGADAMIRGGDNEDEDGDEAAAAAGVVEVL